MIPPFRPSESTLLKIIMYTTPDWGDDDDDALLCMVDWCVAMFQILLRLSSEILFRVSHLSAVVDGTMVGMMTNFNVYDSYLDMDMLMQGC